jgi:hypothetical protein
LLQGVGTMTASVDNSAEAPASGVGICPPPESTLYAGDKLTAARSGTYLPLQGVKYLDGKTPAGNTVTAGTGDEGTPPVDIPAIGDKKRSAETAGFFAVGAGLFRDSEVIGDFLR